MLWRRYRRALTLGTLGLVVSLVNLMVFSHLSARKPAGAETLKGSREYVFSLTTTEKRARYICTVVASLWAQTIPPRQVLIFHGPEVSLPSCPSPSGSQSPYTSVMVPDTGPAIKLRHLLLQPPGGQEYRHKPQHDVIIVDDDSVWHPELARTLLEQRINHPGCVLINNPIANYEHRREILWGAAGYLVPLSVLNQVTWQENPSCRYDDDIWLGYLMARRGVVGISVPGVDHGDIWMIQLEKMLFQRSLSRSINHNGNYRSMCTRSLSNYHSLA